MFRIFPCNVYSLINLKTRQKKDTDKCSIEQ